MNIKTKFKIGDKVFSASWFDDKTPPNITSGFVVAVDVLVMLNGRLDVDYHISDKIGGSQVAIMDERGLYATREGAENEI